MARIKANQSKIFLTLSLAALAGLVFCYIFQTSQINQAGYEIGQKQRHLEETKKEIASLENSLLRNNTLDRYEQQLSDIGYQKIEKIDYIVVSSAVFAANR